MIAAETLRLLVRGPERPTYEVTVHHPEAGAASDLAIRSVSAFSGVARMYGKMCSVRRLAVQRGLDECWPGVWLASFACFPARGRRSATIAAVVIGREPNRMVSFDDAGEPVIETDAEQDRRMFGGGG